jgi:hypothetical protein
MQPVIIPRFLGAMNLLPYSYLHYLGILDFKLAHTASPFRSYISRKREHAQLFMSLYIVCDFLFPQPV